MSTTDNIGDAVAGWRRSCLKAGPQGEADRAKAMLDCLEIIMRDLRKAVNALERLAVKPSGSGLDADDITH
jgi:hypothetical protein